MFSWKKMEELANNVDKSVVVEFFIKGHPVLTAGILADVKEFEFVEIRDIEALMGRDLNDIHRALSVNFIKIPFISIGTAIQLIEDRESGKALFDNSIVAEYYSFNNPNIMNPVKVYSLIEIVFGPEVAEKNSKGLRRLKISTEEKKRRWEKANLIESRR